MKQTESSLNNAFTGARNWKWTVWIVSPSVATFLVPVQHVSALPGDASVEAALTGVEAAAVDGTLGVVFCASVVVGIVLGAAHKAKAMHGWFKAGSRQAGYPHNDAVAGKATTPHTPPHLFHPSLSSTIIPLSTPRNFHQSSRIIVHTSPQHCMQLTCIYWTDRNTTYFASAIWHKTQAKGIEGANWDTNERKTRNVLFSTNETTTSSRAYYLYLDNNFCIITLIFHNVAHAKTLDPNTTKILSTLKSVSLLVSAQSHMMYVPVHVQRNTVHEILKLLHYVQYFSQSMRQTFEHDQ